VIKRAEIIEKLKVSLSPDRFKHCLRVEEIARLLAQKNGVSEIKAELAGLLHDYARKFSGPELIRQASRFKLKIDPISQFEPKLLHAELSALLAKRDFGVKSREVLSAIKKHTLGSPAMTTLEKIIYLADHIEEGRAFSGVEKIRRLAFKDLDQAILESTSSKLNYLLSKRLPIHPGTIRTRNYYLLRGK